MDSPAPSDFLGRGWAFPPRFEASSGSVSMVGDIEDIRQSLHILFHTIPGERVMVPTYGCDLWKYVFRTITAGLLTELRDVVSSAVVKWEPRIDVLSVKVEADGHQAGRVNIEVEFEVRQTNTIANLVFPYYLTDSSPAGEA